MIETVECYANQDGEVIGNKLKSEKSIKTLQMAKKHVQPTETTKECQFIRTYSQMKELFNRETWHQINS